MRPWFVLVTIPDVDPPLPETPAPAHLTYTRMTGLRHPRQGEREGEAGDLGYKGKTDWSEQIQLHVQCFKEFFTPSLQVPAQQSATIARQLLWSAVSSSPLLFFTKAATYHNSTRYLVSWHACCQLLIFCYAALHWTWLCNLHSWLWQSTGSKAEPRCASCKACYHLNLWLTCSNSDAYAGGWRGWIAVGGACG